MSGFEARQNFEEFYVRNDQGWFSGGAVWAPPGASETRAYIRIRWQDGPWEPDLGWNGATVETVLTICLNRLRDFQDSPGMCRENALAITKIEEAISWLKVRADNRQKQGVQHKYEEHKS